MVASLSALVRPGRWWLVAVVAVPTCLALASWWFTAPLDDSPGAAPAAPIAPAPPVVAGPASRPVWPETRLEGSEAKTLILDVLDHAGAKIDRIAGYTATFKKQERIGGKLGAEQTLAMKVRQKPFAIYFKFLAPKAGKEVVYAEGHHGNKVIAHNGDWTRRLVPRLAVEPNSSVALADSRHPVTEAGLSNLTHKLTAFRKLDLEDPEAVTVLDRVTTVDGKLWLRSVHLHAHKNPQRPFARVEVLYDPATYFPMQISSYDWPTPSEAAEPPLAERYRYQDLDIDAPLTALDFDPANPSYEFLRY